MLVSNSKSIPIDYNVTMSNSAALKMAQEMDLAVTDHFYFITAVQGVNVLEAKANFHTKSLG